MQNIMQNVMQQVSLYFQWLSASLPGVLASMLIFFLIVASFLALALLFLILRLFWSLALVISGVKRRKRARGEDPIWERQMRLRALRQQHHWQREDYY